MKYLIPLFVLASLTVSCKRYQYLSISSSSKAIQKNSENQFVEENDSVLVIYELKGRNMPLSIMISNKSDQPLLVDWKRSSVVINDEVISFLPEEEVVAPGSSDREAGALNRDEQADVAAVEQIPPRSHIKKQVLKLAPEYFDRIPRRMYKRKQVELANGRKVAVKEANYFEAVSPLRFSTFLALLPQGKGDENAEPVKLEHVFYVSGIWRSGQFWNMGGRPYVSEPTTFSGIMASVAAVTVVGVVVIAIVAKTVSEANQEVVEENY